MIKIEIEPRVPSREARRRRIPRPTPSPYPRVGLVVVELQIEEAAVGANRRTNEQQKPRAPMAIAQ